MRCCFGWFGWLYGRSDRTEEGGKMRVYVVECEVVKVRLLML